MLLCLAQRLLEDAGDNQFVARVGGEEFAVLFRVDDDGIRGRADDRDAASASPALDYVFKIDGDEQRLRFTCSAGVTEVNAGEAVDDTVKRADRALYEAKRAGKNRAIGRRKGLFAFLPWPAKPTAAAS